MWNSRVSVASVMVSSFLMGWVVVGRMAGSVGCVASDIAAPVVRVGDNVAERGARLAVPGIAA